MKKGLFFCVVYFATLSEGVTVLHFYRYLPIAIFATY